MVVKSLEVNDLPQAISLDMTHDAHIICCLDREFYSPKHVELIKTCIAVTNATEVNVHLW